MDLDGKAMSDGLVEVRCRLTETDLLMQLAEEASELAQAALKKARCLERRNPVAEEYKEQCDDMVKEEYADVMLCARALRLNEYDPSGVILFKLGRWIKRLRETDL